MAQNYNLWQQLIKDAVTYSPGSQAMRDTIQNLTNVLLANKVKRVEAPSFTTQQLAAMGNSGNFANQPSVKNFQEKLANSNNAYQQLQSQLVNPMANVNFNRTFNVSPEEQARQSGAQLYGITQDNQRGTFISPTALRNYIGGASMALSPIAMGGLAGVGGNAGIFARLLAGTVGGAGEGFGMSTPNNALQSTLAGAVGGLAGTFAGELVSNPALRKNIAQGIKKANSGKYKAMLDLGDNSSEVLYHQSQSKEPFKEFLQKGDPGYKKAGYSQAGEGIYFSPDKNLVQSKYGQSGGQLIEARINSKKKLDLGNYDAMYFDGRKVNYGDIVNENFKREIQGINKLPEPDILLTNISKKAKSWLVKNGYDTVEGMKGEMWSAPETVVLDKSIIKILPQVEKVSSNIIKLANAEDIPNTYSNMLKKISQNSNGRQANFARVMDEALSEGNRGERFISTENLPETPKVSMGLGGKKTYSKQAMLAKRSKTAKRIPITSWNENILKSLKNKR